MHKPAGKSSAMFKCCQSPSLETSAEFSHITPIKETGEHLSPASDQAVSNKSFFFVLNPNISAEVKSYSATASRFNQDKK